MERQPTTTIVLNGETVSAGAMTRALTAVCTPEILTEKGGFIFSVQLDPAIIRIGLVPYQIAGQRQYHYHLELPENDCTLTGFFGANGRVDILIKIPPGHTGQTFTAAQISRYRTAYTRFAQFLLDHGVPPDMKLEGTTCMLLHELACFAKTPSTIDELAAASTVGQI